MLTRFFIFFNKRKQHSGFTLIELLIVLAIVSIMSGITLVFLGSGRPERAVETNAQEITAVIHEAQNAALTGKKMTGNGIPLDNTPCSFGVDWNTPNTYRLLYAYKTGGGSCVTPIAITSYVIKNGVTLSGNNVVIFALPHATSSLSAPTTIKLTKDSVSAVVCLYPDGRIMQQAGSTCP